MKLTCEPPAAESVAADAEDAKWIEERSSFNAALGAALLDTIKEETDESLLDTNATLFIEYNGPLSHEAASPLYVQYDIGITRFRLTDPTSVSSEISVAPQEIK